MSMPESVERGELVSSALAEAEIERFCNQFSTPAFVRRGQDIEDLLALLVSQCQRARREMLEMVHLRLRQWAAVATGPDDWVDQFDQPVAPLWTLSDAPVAPNWADQPGSARRRRAVAHDLAVSLSRFNRRWSRYVDELKLGRINDRIANYNHFYLIEKEAVVGNYLVAARLFQRIPEVTPERLFDRFPLLPEVQPRT